MPRAENRVTRPGARLNASSDRATPRPVEFALKKPGITRLRASILPGGRFGTPLAFSTVNQNPIPGSPNRQAQDQQDSGDDYQDLVFPRNREVDAQLVREDRGELPLTRKRPVRQHALTGGPSRNTGHRPLKTPSSREAPPGNEHPVRCRAFFCAGCCSAGCCSAGCQHRCTGKHCLSTVCNGGLVYRRRTGLQ